MATYILGISAFYHDSAAALLADGELIAAAQEERFTRRKHDPAYPAEAIEYCLREGGIGAGNLEYVAFYEKPMAKFERLMESFRAYAPVGFEAFSQGLPVWAEQKLHLPEIIRERLGPTFRGEIAFIEHHESHAASAFYPSPFSEAAILTLDAVGEWGTSSIGKGEGNRIELIHEMRFPHSLGMLYSAFTYYTGFKVNSGEYKLMGLAPYGTPKYLDLIREKVVRIGEDGSVSLEMEYFNYCQGTTMTSESFHELFGGAARKPETMITQKEMDLAASIQALCEEVVLKAANYAFEATGLANLVLAGGVALNCVANGRLLREGPFDRLWIQPAAGDAGGAIGAALSVWHKVLGAERRPMEPDTQKASYLGPSFSNRDIRLYLDSTGAEYEFIPNEEDLLDRVCGLLEDENVVGWFQGRMEFGPRALGARSIIGDARSERMQAKMNLKIKFRESFRPFAPSVLRECADQYFEMRPDEDSPYMLLVAPVRERWRRQMTSEDRRRMKDPDLRIRVSVPRSTVPAITHVDYSARVQTVDAQRHGRYYRLLRRFFETTGCPMIVNTSFNIRGEPIVCTPEDAFRCFMGTEMDVLVLENCVLLKKRQAAGLIQDGDRYRAAYALD